MSTTVLRLFIADRELVASEDLLAQVEQAVQDSGVEYIRKWRDDLQRGVWFEFTKTDRPLALPAGHEYRWKAKEIMNS